MVDAASILSLADRIVTEFRPARLILFGSYAYGDPNLDSDVDLLVVMRHAGPGHRKATQIRLAARPSFPTDLLVRSPAELKVGVAQKDWFIVDVVEKGIVLYDATDASVGAKGRSRLRRRLAPATLAQAKSA